jgi:hypothetical protein
MILTAMFILLSFLVLPVGFQGAGACQPVLPHEAPVAFDIGAQNRTQFPFHAFFWHGIGPFRVTVAKQKSPQQGKMVPWRLRYQTLPVVLGHVSLQKVRVMLLVDRETGLKKPKSE